MRLLWDITDDDVNHIRGFFDLHRDKAFVKNRKQKNVEGGNPPFSKDRFWRQMIGCLRTSQQKSGPTSAVSRLIRMEPFPLAYTTCMASEQPEAFVCDVIVGFGGIRRYERIAAEAAENMRTLNDGLWDKVQATWCRLAGANDPRIEREAAREIDAALTGFCPKQARNLLQGLGLTKYEIPIDSRTISWLRRIDFPLDFPAQALQYSEVYELVLNGLQELCRRCNLYPCMLDAAVFASGDGDGWEGKPIIW